MAIPLFDIALFFSEPLYTIIAVMFCFVIYFRTKEIYELTKYEGIKYFRYAFLFFGFSYLLRFLFSLAFFSRIAFDIFIPRRLFAPLFILPLGYFSTMAIIYLIISSIWKKVNPKHYLIEAHVVALFFAFTSFLSRSHIILLYLQTILLVISLVLSFVIHKKDKKVPQVQTLYILIFILWLINLWIIERMNLLFQVDLFFEIVSIVVFVLIYQKISKWVR